MIGNQLHLRKFFITCYDFLWDCYKLVYIAWVQVSQLEIIPADSTSLAALAGRHGGVPQEGTPPPGASVQMFWYAYELQQLCGGHWMSTRDIRAMRADNIEHEQLTSIR